MYRVCFQKHLLISNQPDKTYIQFIYIQRLEQVTRLKVIRYLTYSISLLLTGPVLVFTNMSISYWTGTGIH